MHSSSGQQQEQQVEKRKIKIKPKVTKVNETTTLEEKKQEHHEECSSSSSPSSSSQKKKVIIIKKKYKERRIYNDIVPPTSIIYRPKQNDFYQTPPKQSCRFFIENKNCFLRERDNACISPISRTVIGFWNEKVGKECKLLPIQDETTYEEVVDIDKDKQKTLSEIVSSSPLSLLPTSPPSPQPLSQLKSTFQKPKSHYVSDAQRARIASEPVSLLRDKIAKKYGIMVKKN